MLQYCNVCKKKLQTTRNLIKLQIQNGIAAVIGGLWGMTILPLLCISFMSLFIEIDVAFSEKMYSIYTNYFGLFLYALMGTGIGYIWSASDIYLWCNGRCSRNSFLYDMY